VKASRVATLLLVVVAGYISAQLASITSGWQFVLEVGAGTGGVYLLRWYWWRINAWSEISAMATALVVSAAVRLWAPFTGSGPVVFAKSALTTTAVTTLVWIGVTLVTPPESDDVLARFYRKVRPHLSGWRRIARLAPEVAPTRDLGRNLLAWLLGSVMVYAALFSIGKLCFGRLASGAALLALAAACAGFLYADISHRVAQAEK